MTKYSTWSKLSFSLFLSWKLITLISLIVAINLVPLAQQDRFLGGGVNNYLTNSLVFAWANFDGEHYLSIAIHGYKGLEQAFFPIYPKLINVLASPIYKSIPCQELQCLTSALFYSSLAGLLISNLAIFFALVLLWKLLKLDYPDKIIWWTLVLLLIFPTSFYLGAVYSESIYLLISVAAFYALRKNHWWLAGVLGAVASATRVFGVILWPVFILEAFLQGVPLRKWIWVMLVPVGLLLYMYYQYVTVGDPLAFYKLQKIVGEQHQSGLTLLPQVYWRYLKMLATVDVTSPIYQTIVLEFFTGIVFLLLPIIGYLKKMRPSYIVYALIGFLLPTIQGSFSSLPRYVLVFFPAFLAAAIWLSTLPKMVRLLIVGGLSVWLGVETMLFLRGYWVA